ncbi:hypothetical protein HPP92_004176 [Vanilla planifolia]|uniref:PB1 domain-containing protein n=1 Tax=Vanilla planifolia TaxID=51239 RepID=A0A835S9C3_VANPL|nr:hypothetical protein HPP92_004617 [Vanilla planifolia]KAG0504104.1 hypothetical protein HPP92_004176 [Vanilla planifolia]
MVGTSSSSSSSCASFGSFDDNALKSCCTVKFLCSYGGRILPRYLDGKLRYVGGETRVLAVDRSVPFSELRAKLGELCGWETVNLRCQLPTEDLDALVSVTSDEDLANLFEEYDLASRDRQCPMKIRAFLHPSSTKSPKSSTPIYPAATRPMGGKAPFQYPVTTRAHRCVRQITTAAAFPGRSGNDSRLRGHKSHRIPASAHHHLIHHGNYYH